MNVFDLIIRSISDKKLGQLLPSNNIGRKVFFFNYFSWQCHL